MRPNRLARLIPVLLLTALVVACGKDKATDPASTVVPDFQLTDVNPNSPTAGRLVSPRDHLHQVSAWYFGHST